MSISAFSPCSMDGICPYAAMYNCDCEYYCGVDEPQDDPAIWEEDEDE